MIVACRLVSPHVMDGVPDFGFFGGRRHVENSRCRIFEIMVWCLNYEGLDRISSRVRTGSVGDLGEMKSGKGVNSRCV